MIARKPLFLAPFALATAGLTACASLLGGQPVKVRPVENLSSLTPAQTDPLYESAVTAINVRDYARALDYLQQDKSENPKNIKVLNALGVIYDKLGRFDLSARYYGQAQAVDPSSRIVAANLEYSKVLQGWQGVDQNRSVAALQAPVSQSAPPANAVSILSAEPAATVHLPQVEERAFNTVLPKPSLVSAPVIRPAESHIVAVSIPPEMVAPAASQVQTASINGPNSPAPIRPFVLSPEKQRVASLAVPPQTKVWLTAAVDSSLGKPAPSIPSTLPAVLPIYAAPVNPVARPEDKQLAVASAAPQSKPATSKPVIAPAIEPVVTLSALAMRPLISENRAKANVADNRRAQERTVALPAPVPAAPEARKTEERSLAYASPSVSISAPQDVVVQKALLPQHHEVTVAPPPHVENRQAAVLSAAPTAKPLKLKAEARVPAAFREMVVAAAPIKTVMTIAGNGKVLTTGRPVKILNASGRLGEIGTLSHRLTVLGWTVRQSNWRMQPATTLYYPAKNIVAAKAMVRTLPFPVRFLPDNDDSFAMRLVIGRDFISWKPRNARLAALWQNGAVVASLQKPTTRGVR